MLHADTSTFRRLGATPAAGLVILTTASAGVAASPCRDEQ